MGYPQSQPRPNALAIPIVYEDDALVVVDKPPGIMTHRGFGDRSPALLQRARDALGVHLYPIHRLDRPTSGLVVFGRDPGAAAHLAWQFRLGLPRKRYIAWVRGRPPEFGVLDHPVPRAKDGPRLPARTAWCRHLLHAGYSLVEAAPRTGRYHQIRRHLKHMSAPILGDVRYGDGRHNRRVRTEYGLHRLALHAFQLVLDHPVTGRRLDLRAPVPPDLATALESWCPGALDHLPPGAGVQKALFRDGPAR
jgi:tRNA pseudouridine65 synthase